MHLRIIFRCPKPSQNIILWIFSAISVTAALYGRPLWHLSFNFVQLHFNFVNRYFIVVNEKIYSPLSINLPRFRRGIDWNTGGGGKFCITWRQSTFFMFTNLLKTFIIDGYQMKNTKQRRVLKFKIFKVDTFDRSNFFKTTR